MLIFLFINIVLSTTHVEYKFSSSFGDYIYDYSGNNLHGASGYYGSQKAKSTDRGIYIDGSDHSIVVQETYSNDKLSSPFTITLWTMSKSQPGLIFYRSRSNSNYLSIIGKTTDATIGFKVVISGTSSEYFCPVNSFEVGNYKLGKWTLAQLTYQSSTFTLYTQTCTVASSSLSYTESVGILYNTCLGSYKTNLPAFYGYIWYFNIKLVAEDASIYIEYGPVYSCGIKPCANCSYAFKDPDYGNICLSEETDDTKNSYLETCTSIYGCSKSLNFQCLCPTSTCVYSPSASTCGCVDSSNVLSLSNCQCNSPYKLISGKCCNSLCSSCATSDVCTGCSDPNAEVILEICECKTGFYGTPSSTSTTGCISCNPGCNTCAITICDSCFDINAEIIGSSCVCKSGFYGTPSGISSGQCNTCGYGCSDCVSNTTCNTCIDPNAEGSTGDCLCNTGFYGNASTTNITSCFPCKDKCSVCQDSNTCSLCSDTNAQVQNNECVCKTGFYLEVLNNSLCQSCSYGCYNCSETQCFTCFDPQAQPNGSNCECQPGYFGTPSNSNISLCIQCGTGCSQCTAVNNCLSCFEENAEVISGECVCKSGFYGTPSYNNGCKSCILGCSLCFDYISCNETFDPNAEILNSEVRCKNGFFGQIDNSNQSCFECNSECSLCESINACLECIFKNFQLIDGKCECLDGFYLSPNGSECIECPDQCLTCFDNGNCIDCKTENSLFDKEKGCVCKTGYYNSTLPTGIKCEQCMDECKECENEFTCKICKNAFTVLNSTGRCTCKEGYYNSNPTNTSIKCEPCDSACKSCNNEGVCVDCLGNNTEIKENGKCECLNKFYSKSSTYIDCEYCPGFRIEGKCDSFCPIGFGWVNGTCYECGELCNECDEALICLNCTYGANLTDGKCNCMKNSKCSSKEFKVLVSIKFSNQLILEFSKILKNDLNSSSLSISSNSIQEIFYIKKLSDSQYQINLKKKGSSRRIKIEFSKDIVSVDSSPLVTEILYIRTFKEKKINEEDSTSGDFAKNGMLLGLALTLSFGFLHLDLSKFYNLMNFGEIFSLIALYDLEINQDLLKYLINLRISKELPNIFMNLMNIEKSTEPETIYFNYGYKTTIFYVNSGMSIMVIILLFIVSFIITKIPKKISENYKFFIYVKNCFEYNAFLRYFIQSFLDTALSCSHSLKHFAYNTNTSSFNIYLSLLFIVITNKIWQFYFYLYTVFLIYSRQSLTQNELIGKFEARFESLFKDFKTHKMRLTLFYFIFTTRRYLLIAIIFLINDPALKLILSFTISVSIFFYLILFKCFINSFDNTIHITNELSTMLVYFFIFLSLTRGLTFISSNIVIIVTVIISISLTINVIGTFISFFKFIKKKFCEKSRANIKVEPIIIEVSRFDDEGSLASFKSFQMNNEALKPNSLIDSLALDDLKSNNQDKNI